MQEPYFSPHWTRQQALAQHALALFIPGMQQWNTTRKVPEQFWDAYWFITELRNKLFEGGGRSL